jgi:hypothetical protein
MAPALLYFAAVLSGVAVVARCVHRCNQISDGATMTPASPAHSVESISLVTDVCGHRREQALPINDRPVDLARSDELP